MGTQLTQQTASRYSKHNLVVDGDTTTTALAAPVPSPTRPTTDIIELGNAPLMRFIFGGTNADDETINYQVIAWYLVKMPGTVADTWMGVPIAQGTFTVGANAITGITTGFFADTITDSVSTQTSLVTTIANSVAMLTVDTQNAEFLQIATDLGTAAAAYAWAIPGEFAR